MLSIVQLIQLLRSILPFEGCNLCGSKYAFIGYILRFIFFLLQESIPVRFNQNFQASKRNKCCKIRNFIKSFNQFIKKKIQTSTGVVLSGVQVPGCSFLGPMFWVVFYGFWPVLLGEWVVILCLKVRHAEALVYSGFAINFAETEIT